MLTDNTTLDKELELKLTRLYVALTMTRNVAKLGLNPDSMIKLLDVASELLEEILDNKDPDATTTSIANEVELVM